MNYIVSENGKYFYKIGKDKKKVRISKEEYIKKTKTRKLKIGGEDTPVQWVIIIGSSGNLSPSIQKMIPSSVHKTVYKGSDFDLTKQDGIESLIEKIKILSQTEAYKGKKGAVIFVSAERDPAMFEKCKDDVNYNTYKKTNTTETLSLEQKREGLWNLNMKAPVQVFTSIMNLFTDMIFVYISTIYVFNGNKKGLVRKEVIEDSTHDFINIDLIHDINIGTDTLKNLFETNGKNLYAYGKRYVELKLNNIITTQPSAAKVVILRMDGITPENPEEYKDGTFLLALSSPESSFNMIENRYPVFPTQISKVIIGAITKQQDKIKVYHVAGTERKKGLTKAEMICKIVAKDDAIKIDRKMDDSNSLSVAQDYIDGNEEDFIEKLRVIYNNLKTKKEKSLLFGIFGGRKRV